MIQVIEPTASKNDWLLLAKQLGFVLLLVQYVAVNLCLLSCMHATRCMRSYVLVKTHNEHQNMDQAVHSTSIHAVIHHGMCDLACGRQLCKSRITPVQHMLSSMC